MAQLVELEQRMGYTFREQARLQNAVTHSSYANELSRHMHHIKDNERLEFLGDAVLELVTSEFIYENHKDMPEGKLSKLRASIVCEPSLAICARDLALGEYLRLGKGEMVTGGKERDSILSDAFEAVIGAIYLDGGMEPARAFIKRFVLDNLEKNQLFLDSKTVLQEITQKQYGSVPEYQLVKEEGPAHCRNFTVDVLIAGKRLAEGTGTSKKHAEQNAAFAAIKLLREEKGELNVSQKH